MYRGSDVDYCNYCNDCKEHEEDEICINHVCACEGCDEMKKEGEKYCGECWGHIYTTQYCYEHTDSPYCKGCNEDYNNLKDGYCKECIDSL